MSPAHCRSISFGGRTVLVGAIEDGELFVVDPDRQTGLTPSQTRIWLAHKNQEAIRAFAYVPTRAVTLPEVGLALRGYAANLNADYVRPTELDVDPYTREADFDYEEPDSDDGYDPIEKELDRERKELMADIYDDREDWARSEDTGWFYGDES